MSADSNNSERDKIAELEAKVEALTQQLNNLVKKISDLTDHANYHTHTVSVGDWDCYGNNSKVVETNLSSSNVDCP